MKKVLVTGVLQLYVVDHEIKLSDDEYDKFIESETPDIGDFEDTIRSRIELEEIVPLEFQLEDYSVI